MIIPYLTVTGVVSAKPGGRQQRRVALRLKNTRTRPASGRTFYREVPVGQRKLGVDTLQAVFESVRQQRVARQEA